MVCDKELKKLAHILNVTVTHVVQSDDHSDAKDNCWCAGNEIFIGEYEDKELLLISFFHEYGHC